LNESLELHLFRDHNFPRLLRSYTGRYAAKAMPRPCVFDFFYLVLKALTLQFVDLCKPKEDVLRLQEVGLNL